MHQGLAAPGIEIAGPAPCEHDFEDVVGSRNELQGVVVGGADHRSLRALGQHLRRRARLQQQGQFLDHRPQHRADFGGNFMRVARLQQCRRDAGRDRDLPQHFVSCRGQRRLRWERRCRTALPGPLLRGIEERPISEFQRPACRDRHFALRRTVAGMAGRYALLVDRHEDDITADQHPVAVAQPMRAGHALARSVDIGSVARDVMQPERACLVADLAMPAGDELVGVRQGPVASIASDLEAAIPRRVAGRDARRQGVDIVDLQTDVHPGSPSNTDRYSTF